MEDNLIYDRYKELAIAIIRQSLLDFLYNEGEYYKLRKEYPKQKQKFVDWVLFCEYFDLLPLNRELFIKRSLMIKEKRVNVL